MNVSFNQIPSALRYPGVYIEVDGSQAGLGGDIPAVLIVGQKLATGTAAAGEITLVSSVADAKAKAGAGSMLAKMVEAYRKGDSALDVYMLPYADNAAGVAATGSVVVTASPTADGTLSLYVASVLVSVGVMAGQTPAAIATAIATAINAAADMCVTAAAVAATVTLTAKHKGSVGNNIDLRINLYGEKAPTGLTQTITAMSGGTGDPAPGDITSIIGQRWYRYVVLGMSDNATLAAWHTESQLRYKPPIQAGFRAFAAFRGDHASAVAYGSAKNYEHIATLALGLNPTTTWEAAAMFAAAAAPKLYNNPVESLEGTPLVGMVATTYYEWTQANSLLFKGMSVLLYTKDGSCTIKRAISMYQTRADGSADDAYLDINAAEAMERIRYEQRMAAIKRFTGTAAAKTNEGYAPGLRITTEDDVRALLLSLYKNTLVREYGWCQAYDYYKDKLVVEQDPQNPSRFNYVDAPVLLSPFYILAGRAQFRKDAV
ncbi:phage tail protein [Limnohabitans sp.]|uniref:phage tail protein n=1 Tax=Limnohabitans sp. TaxID=1907725 RepID=UPI00286F9E3F|nr:phage tail protein [Limnohabitans sp.]